MSVQHAHHTEGEELDPRDRKERTRLGAGSESSAGTETGTGSRVGTRSGRERGCER